MEYRRRVQRGEDQWGEVSRRKSQSKRPPRGPQGSWQRTVPSWEKSFCKVVGLLDWESVLEMKKFAFLFDNVVKWDSSAGEEAFQNAKNRFWSQLHGIPCDISLPDPDLYIDEIDWDCKVDPEMLLDLDSKPVDTGPDEKHEGVIIFGDALIPNDAFSASGWGEEENFRKATNSSLNNHEDQWEHGWKNNETTKQSGWNGEWGLEEDTGWGGEQREDSQNLEKGSVITGDTGWGSGWVSDYQFENSEGRNWASGKGNGCAGDWDDSREWGYEQQKENCTDLKAGNAHYNSFSGTHKRGNGGRYIPPKYKNSWNEHHRNGKGKRCPSREWTEANNFGHAWVKTGQAWSWKKAVM
ncbi:uncharacterized protein LOC116028542 [Ipomoea triloba]|uniref:uncharacterized protein LOC116028542 n=1 Tax=Ipomoea triloba TaxID=35885 RepID=UPI00125DE1FB|nr:uncharacterized protein LOC116028542 [Ipomoea triloba]